MALKEPAVDRISLDQNTGGDVHASDKYIPVCPTLRLAAALATVHSYSGCIKAFTDGSARGNAEVRSGYGALVQYLGAGDQAVGGSRVELSGPCGNISNYEAEMEAIRHAITAIGAKLDDKSERIGDVVIFTDILSVLQAIDGLGTWPVRLVHTLAAISDFTQRHRV